MSKDVQVTVSDLQDGFKTATIVVKKTEGGNLDLSVNHEPVHPSSLQRAMEQDLNTIDAVTFALYCAYMTAICRQGATRIEQNVQYSPQQPFALDLKL